MAVNVSPATALGFNRPFTEPVKRTLIVTNNNTLPVAFKVKTTAPKAYCVRPNSGRIEPGECIEIQVILQGMKEDPPPGARCKDKFLVQSMTITPDMKDTSYASMWSQADADPSSHTVHSERIKVIFLPPEGETEVPVHDTTFLSANDSRYDTVRSIPSPSQANGAIRMPEPVIQIPEPVIQSRHEDIDRGTSPAPDFQHASDEHPRMEEVVTQPPIVIAPATPIKLDSSPSSEQIDDLRTKLADAQGEIDRLRGLLIAPPATESATSGYKRRAVSGSPTEIGDTETEFSPGESVSTIENGVPPQVVAIVALLVFTLTYLFF